MASTCTITKCDCNSYAKCDCCQQIICLFHLKEHRDLLISQLNPLINQITILENRVKAFTAEKMIGNACETLQQWRIDCYKKIDKFIEEKSQQLTAYVNNKIDKQRDDIDQIRSKVTKLINKEKLNGQHLDSIKSKIIDLEKEITKTEQTTFHIQMQSFVTSDDLIRIKESNPYQFDLSSLSPASKTIKTSKKNWAALATNEKYLLIHQESNLCLVDQKFTIIKQIPWAFGEIWDMFWSSVLDRFIVINQNSIFLIDDDMMSMKTIQTLNKHAWCCGTCSDKSLFLATYRRGASIIELSLLPTIEFVKHWKPPETCSADEGIHDMAYNDENIFMVIENQVKRTVRVELRSSPTLNRLWSLRMDSADNLNVQIRCCLFNYNEWIVVYHDLNCLLHITKDGKLKGSFSYTPPPHFASRFGFNHLVVTTSTSINLHKIQF
ncbi:unnamed protein product [Rotaria magnacalcarata]|uniref:Uncharacterized protein n=1 Tax=Rotaria magnacalcarata TaxID=392030 RepID=A0A814I520_9BILA|nr:unnamed protein product [Rotaria magnacalcarata]CAF1682108.1 unnamed protein product [Rotaria magnacalcarata]CAF2086335.1 unnamed protein product [Rotaria magnacalcarata]CAF2159155.1 unnamed protein product [Rotaria magnacalcarata]CAF4057126.1 unnamed protein product [Rotaria magnacalcarata]